MRSKLSLASMRYSLLLVNCLVLSFVFGCGSDDDTQSDKPSGPSPASGPITKLAVGWTTIEPGGSTICSRKTPYRFFVRPGKINRVLIEFEGGGACWNTLTCGIGSSTFKDDVQDLPWLKDESKAVGIADHRHDANPFKDWHHVYIPYCTADVHWGDASASYPAAPPINIEHRGASNAKVALDWAYANIPSPDKVFVTGCSAGGYGSAFWSTHISKHYDQASVTLLSDAAAGIITDTFYKDSFPVWNVKANFPDFIGVNPDAFDTLPPLYVGAAKSLDNLFLAQYNAVYDKTQHFFYKAMGGGDAKEWSQKMRSSVDEIAQGTQKFRSYLAPGAVHCIIVRPEYYTLEVGGVRLTDWISDLAHGKGPASVDCGASDCGQPAP